LLPLLEAAGDFDFLLALDVAGGDAERDPTGPSLPAGDLVRGDAAAARVDFARGGMAVARSRGKRLGAATEARAQSKEGEQSDRLLRGTPGTDTPVRATPFLLPRFEFEWRVRAVCPSLCALRLLAVGAAGGWRRRCEISGSPGAKDASVLGQRAKEEDNTVQLVSRVHEARRDAGLVSL